MSSFHNLKMYFSKIWHRPIILGQWALTSGIISCMVSPSWCASSSELVAAEITKSTVRIVAVDQKDNIGHGTGFVISADGHVATNSHVLDSGIRFYIVYSDGKRVRIRRATIAGISTSADLAILQSDPIPGVVVAKISTSGLVVGQTVSAVGFPGVMDTTQSWATMNGVEKDEVDGDGWIIDEEAKSDFQPAVFPGSVAKLAVLSGVSSIFHSAKISPGNSGGPLIDENGRVCGINTAFIPAGSAGSDYPISVDASALIALAQTHSIPIKISSSTGNSSHSYNGTFTFSLILITAFVLITMYFMMRRKPVTAKVNVIPNVASRSGSNGPDRIQLAKFGPRQHSCLPEEILRLSGHDIKGRCYSMSFSLSDFQRSGGIVTIGRNSKLCQLCMPHDSVSRQHAVLSLRGETIYVQDMNSANGTKVNNVKLIPGAKPTILRSGDILTLGELALTFEI